MFGSWRAFKQVTLSQERFEECWNDLINSLNNFELPLTINFLENLKQELVRAQKYKNKKIIV